MNRTIATAHGLPKLVNEEDYDTDLPLDCDFDDATATDLPLNLPGEDTRISIFLTYIKLSRIMSKCIKKLYTTTQRRGGIEKISMLDRELRVWEQSCGISFCSERLDPAEDHSGRARTLPSRSYEDQVFSIPYLQIMSNLAMILIHQPALTFGPGSSQFRSSLSISLQSYMNILKVYDRNKSERRLFYLHPNGARIVFQGALMSFYYHWHSEPLAPDHETSTEHETKPDMPLRDVIGTTIDLLKLQLAEYTRIETLNAPHVSSTETLSSAVSTLNMLAARTDQVISGGNNALTQTCDIDMSQEGESLDSDIWGPTALENLNQLDIQNWGSDFGPQRLDPYLIDLSILQ